MADITLQKLNLINGDILTQEDIAKIDSNTDIAQNKINEHSNKIGDLTGNGLTEVDLATAIKNDRTQLSDMAKHISGYVNVKDFGVVGSIGSGNYIDETDLFQQAISYAQNNQIRKIVVPCGIYAFTKTLFIARDIEIDFNNSILVPIGTIENYINGYMICINSANGIDWISAFAGFNTTIKNIRFSNYNNIVGIKSIFLATIGEIYNFRTESMYGTIEIAGRYIDIIKIHRGLIIDHKGTDYAIQQLVNDTLDSRASGDAWEISNIQTEGDNGLLLHMNGDNSPVNISNILNGYIYLENGNFNLNNIHIEEGMLTSKNCLLNIKNAVLYRSYETKTPLKLLTDNGVSKQVILENIKIVFKYWRTNYGLSFLEYAPDILIEDNFYSMVTTINCSKGLYLKNNDKALNGLLGLSIGKYTVLTNTIVPLSIFNNNSAQLSNFGVFNIKSISSPTLTSFFYPSNFAIINYMQVLESATWKFNSGTFHYRISAILDWERKVGYTNSLELSVVVNNTDNKIVEIYSNPESGINNCLLLVERGTTSGVYNYYALCPLSDISAHLYDDYNTINGVEWKSIDYGTLNLLKGRHSIKYISAGITIVYANNIPNTGTWNKGDKIINANPVVGSAKSWICTSSGTPGTWVGEGNL